MRLFPAPSRTVPASGLLLTLCLLLPMAPTGTGVVLAEASGSLHEGASFSTSEFARVNAAILGLAGVDDEAMAGLLAMLGSSPSKSRIYRERAAPGGSCFTLTDSTRESSRGDRIAVPETTLLEHDSLLAAALVGQWERVRGLVNNCFPLAPGEPPLRGEHIRRELAERPALQRELAALKAFQEQARLDGNQDLDDVLEVRIDHVECKIVVLGSNSAREGGQPAFLPFIANCPMTRTPGLPPRFSVGFSLGFQNSSGNGSVLRTDLQVDGLPITTGTTPLPIAYAQDLAVIREAVLPRGGWGAIVAGMHSNLTEGRLVGFEVFDFGVTAIVFLLRIPGLIPERITHDPVGGRLFVLDRAGQQIRVLRDLTGDGFPETLEATPFATAVDFPFLAGAKSFFFDATSGSGGVLRVSLQSTDARDAFYEMDDLQFELADDDGDGTADRATPIFYKEDLVFPPTFTEGLEEGDLSVAIHGTWGGPVRVVEDSTDTVLGDGVVDNDDPSLGICCIATVALNRALVRGEAIRVEDPTRTFQRDPDRCEVEPRVGAPDAPPE